MKDDFIQMAKEQLTEHLKEVEKAGGVKQWLHNTKVAEQKRLIKAERKATRKAKKKQRKAEGLERISEIERQDILANGVDIPLEMLVKAKVKAERRKKRKFRKETAQGRR